MTFDKTTFTAVRIGLYVGGMLARDIITADEADEQILDKMQENGVPEEAFAEIQMLAYDAKSFGDHVRAAERKKLPVAKVYGETLPE